MENYLIIIIRTLIGFFTFFILMRFMGKREVGQLSLFDLIIILSKGRITYGALRHYT